MDEVFAGMVPYFLNQKLRTRGRSNTKKYEVCLDTLVRSPKNEKLESFKLESFYLALKQPSQVEEFLLKLESPFPTALSNYKYHVSKCEAPTSLGIFELRLEVSNFFDISKACPKIC